LLRIAIANLLDNALKYAAPDTPIAVRLTLASQASTPGIRLNIANVPGRAGWPDADRVFTKYYRGRRAQSQTGSGLGLYLVRVIADRLGAQVAYRPNDATVVFEFWLPLPPDSIADAEDLPKALRRANVVTTESLYPHQTSA
jgi:signal transduction histidine kinase